MSTDQTSERCSSETSSLVVENVCFSWPSGKKALEKCTFSIPRPGLWMLVGSNGSGKSTLFRLIAGMISADRGQIYSKLKPALMFQNPDHQLLLPTCGSDLVLSLPRHLTRDECLERIDQALDEVGLSGMASRPIHTLSGGQKQRLALAGALASKSNLLLLDEPTALLDPGSQKLVLEIVKKLSSRIKDPITAIWITHRLEELEYCDGAARMESGRVGRWETGSVLRKLLTPLAISRG